MYNRDLSVYDQNPILFPVKKIKDKYLLKDTLIRTSLSKIGFAIGAYDCEADQPIPMEFIAEEFF